MKYVATMTVNIINIHFFFFRCPTLATTVSFLKICELASAVDLHKGPITSLAVGLFDGTALYIRIGDGKERPRLFGTLLINFLL
ncbi:MAG: hypothetical protein AB8G05_26350 [Oligoflexales bacterium]